MEYETPIYHDPCMNMQSVFQNQMGTSYISKGQINFKSGDFTCFGKYEKNGKKELTV